MSTIIINGVSAVRYILKGGLIEGTALTYAFLLSHSSYLHFSCYPDLAWERTDIQGILNSIVLQKEESITIPNGIPGEPIYYTP